MHKQNTTNSMQKSYEKEFCLLRAMTLTREFMPSNSKAMNRTSFYFLALGLWTTIPPMVITWVAIEDILSGVLWSTTVVLISYSIPEIISKLLSPLVVNKISFGFSFVLLTALFIGSIVLMLAVDDVRLRIVGVGVHGIANGFTVITCVRMLAYYEQALILANAYQNGSNASAFLASFGYTALTTWLCVTPRIAIASCIPICVLPLGIYLLLDKKPLEDHARKTLDLSGYESLTAFSESATSPSKPIHRVAFLVKVFPYISYAYISNFCLHLSITAALTSLTFSSSPFSPRDHFQYYRLVSDAGIWISGMGSFLVTSHFSQNWREFFSIRRIWILVFLNVFHVFLFVFASWHRLIPNVVIVLILCFTQGSCHGLVLVQSMMSTASLFASPKDNGTAMGLQEVGISVGRVAAGFLGIITEKYLREHCTNRLLLGHLCLARHLSHAKWSTNTNCKF